MAKQTINIGTTANDSTGDPLRTAFDKTNDNFDELYTADGLKADIASPTLTGTPAAPTAGAATNSTQLATTAFVQQELSSGTTALLTSNFIDDDTMATATATTISSSESTKAYVDTLISGTDTMHYKGDYNASTNSPDLDSPTAGTVFTGDTYYVATAGTAFFSETLVIGDLLISQVDDPSTVDDWVVFQQSTELATDLSPQLGGQLDINGNSIGDGTLELLSFSETASAVNELTITNAATTGAPQLSATGDDTNIDLDLQPKGSGNVILGNYTLDGDQTVGVGQDNYVLTYDNATGNISLEVAAAGGGDALVANGLDQFAATTSAELAGVISDETGSGALCFATSPTLVTPALGTPASGVMTNVTGTAASLTAGTATTSDALSTTGASVDVAAAAPPSTGQVLKATSATTATWQAEAGGTTDLVTDLTPQLGSQLDVNGFAIGDGTLELLSFTETGSAVNHINVTNAATGNGPELAAAGDDTNADLAISAKGTGEIIQTAEGVVHRNGNFATAGDAQVMNYVLKGSSATNGAFTEIFLGSGDRMVVPDDTTWAFDALIVARLGTLQASAAYNVFGCIDNESGTVALVGAVQYGTSIEDSVAPANFDVQFTADDANNSLKLEVKGGIDLGDAVKWVASIRISQVTNATSGAY